MLGVEGEQSEGGWQEARADTLYTVNLYTEAKNLLYILT